MLYENISKLKKKEQFNWKIFRSSTSFYVLIPLRVLITSTFLNAQVMIALFIFLLGERKRLKAFVIQYRTMMRKATSIIIREKTQKKNSSLLSWKSFQKGSRYHGISFSPSAQTALKVARIATCTECHKPRLLYSRAKLKDRELRSFKRVLNDFQFACGSVFQEIMVDKNNPDETV